jgi:hypothetical protein
MNTINPDPGDDFFNLSIEQSQIELIRALALIAEGHKMIDEGESMAECMAERLCDLVGSGTAQAEYSSGVTA